MPTIFRDKVISGTVNAADVSYTHALCHGEGYGIQIKYSGMGISGSMAIQGTINGEDFIEIEDSNISFTDNSGSYVFEAKYSKYGKIRIVCTSTTGDVFFEAWMLVNRPSKIQ